MRFLARIVLLITLIAFFVRPSYTYAATSSNESAAIPTQSALVQSSANTHATKNLVKVSGQSGSTADIQINRATSSMAGRKGIIFADYSANQTWVTCPNWGTQ